MNNSSILQQLKENRELLFERAKSRISSTNNSLAERKRREQILRNTQNVANAIMRLVYEILTKADTKTAYINVRKVDRKLGEPYDKPIDDTKPSYYVFDDDSLTIYLNYSHVHYDYFDGDFGSYGGKCFLENINEESLKAILEQYGINYSRYVAQCVESMTDTSINVITIKVKNKIKEKTV